MKTIARSNKHILAIVLAATLVLTAIFGFLAVSHSKAVSPASLEEKKAGWYAVRSGAVDLACNGVLQNKYGSWFVEDGRVNFGYTGWLVCEGTYYYVTSGKADKPTSLPAFAIPKTKSNATTGANGATTVKAGSGSTVKGANSSTQAPNGSASNGAKNSNSGSSSNETNGSNSSGNATKAANKQTTKAPATTKTPATTKAAPTTKKASTTKKATTKPTTKKPSTKAPTQSQTQPTSPDIPVTLDEDELPIIAD